MFTELIFGAELKKDTPKEIIDCLEYMIGENENEPKNFPFYGWTRYMLRNGSYYFAINRPVSKMWFDKITQSYHISTRSNFKNYDGNVEEFLEWIKPYIDSGSGSNDMYAIVTYEEQEVPDIYYLHK